MNTLRSTVIVIVFSALASCNNSSKTDKVVAKTDVEVYAREPNDSADYKLLKYDLYLSKNGQLCERKLVFSKGTTCNCLFEVYYDSLFRIYTEDTIIEKPLSTIIDIGSFVWLDSTQYSKDKKNVYYFQGNSDGGSRVIVDNADPLSFKRLCEYRWGIDQKHVFYEGNIVQGIELKHLQVLYPPDTTDHFVNYIKDNRNVFYHTEIVEGADAKTFRIVSGQKWDAEDKNYKYEAGRRKD